MAPKLRRRVTLENETTPQHNVGLPLMWVVTPYVAILIIFAIMFWQDRAEDNRNRDEAEREKAVLIAQIQYNLDLQDYQLGTVERTNCLNTAASRDDLRANWLSLFALLQARFSNTTDFLPELQREFEKNTPKLDPAKCPPPLEPPEIPVILLVEELRDDRIGTNPSSLTD